ncbi:hypothetical protein OXB_3005 [Bacillus sp. OxB-1]|nr:hypothetical protein [Bacillus sp. OxB-1]BAQ11475.1 hypothetical protein OXB_3005 [Bacillus sp. OxB-1]
MANRKKYVIEQLHKIGVYASPENTPLELLSYPVLKGLLAVKRAITQ